ncbi:40S ribosomal protein S20-2 [Camellia lanceoleosa]|uniref:40S ribosomal protein S20-2 n=1 Tax=Camellia lanceoleosa TaxID=1840588 RepID=A0ACC0J1W2_9ERIC|nr:40S ribosomal protein S20-2 [Camellia lanceoleosa]
MAYVAMRPTKLGLEESQEQIHKIRITLSSKSVKNLKKGTNTWDRFELRVHKRVIDLFSSPDVVKKITSIAIEPGVERLKRLSLLTSSHFSSAENGATMAYAAMKPTKPGLQNSQDQIHKIRITLSSKNVKNLEKVCANLVRGAKDRRLRVKGLAGMRTKVLHITTRKVPCGEGTNTWDRFELRVHKRVIDLFISSDVVK